MCIRDRPLPPHDPPPIQGGIIAVLRGSCCLEVPDHAVKQPLSGGDVVLINGRSPFVLRDAWHSSVKNVHDVVKREHIEQMAGLQGGGGGVETTFLTGLFRSDGDERPSLLATLPPVICIRGSEPQNAPWLEGTLKFLHAELTHREPGSQSVVDHLAHTLFIQAVRAYAATLPEDAPGSWFHAIFDPELATAIGLIDMRLQEPWTVASLAEASGISRSSFAARFTASVGRPPLQYLTERRMHLARELLRETNLGIKAIAAKVGYSNDAAFSNAFRRESGMSPGAFRRNAEAGRPRPLEAIRNG